MNITIFNQKSKYKVSPINNITQDTTQDTTQDITEENLEELFTPIKIKRTISQEEMIFNKLYSNYATLLENVPTFKNINKKTLIHTKLYNIVLEFLKKHKINKILLSLSGGVDSMVLLEILDCINKNTDYPIIIYCCHINYNNRYETVQEKNFLQSYCDINEIHFEHIDIKFTRNETKRSVYESKTRSMRYEYYKWLCELFGCSGVFLGHHKDDICENIFNNIMKGGHDISDLKVIKDINNIMNVTVYRPMIEVYKDEIYEIANNYNIPYFLDTTPEWSCRGKMRSNIFPQCTDCYTDIYKENLIKLASNGQELGNIVNEYIINDILKSVTYNKNSFTIPWNKVLKETVILQTILKQICYHLNINIMKEKHIHSLCNLVDNHVGKIKMTLFHNYDITISKETINFIHTWTKGVDTGVGV